MRYTSTRSAMDAASAQAIAQGIAADGGLYVPKSFPVLSEDILSSLVPMSYKDRAAAVLGMYLTDFSPDEIRRCVDGAYTGTFEKDNPAPLVEVEHGMFFLELWHGPTCAFKDMALQLLPYLLVTSAQKTEPDKNIVILVATSGDTGKAALDGFADVDKTRIIVFYPCDGVSPMQKLQMTTQAGNNVAVCAIKGNFDDAQTGVKQIFANPEMRQFLKARNLEFSSANSINFGRLVPQIVYYVSAYCDLLKSRKIKTGEGFNVAVPTGNFGNILAAFYAKQMGIPIKKFICASNCNNILTDFIRTGIYDRNRKFHTTISPSMDILISSNLERMLYFLYDGNASAVSERMARLRASGRYEVEPEILTRLQNEFWGGFCDDDATRDTIGDLFREHHYLCDPHTGVAVNVYRQYSKETGDASPCVIASTASPYKFAAAVLPAVGAASHTATEMEMLQALSDATGTPIPAPLKDLANRPILHKACVDKSEMAAFIQKFLA